MRTPLGSTHSPIPSIHSQKCTARIRHSYGLYFIRIYVCLNNFEWGLTNTQRTFWSRAASLSSLPTFVRKFRMTKIRRALIENEKVGERVRGKEGDVGGRVPRARLIKLIRENIWSIFWIRSHFGRNVE